MQSQAPLYCSQCAAPLYQGTQFCSKCGSAVTAPNAAATVPLPPQQKQKPKSFWRQEVVSDASLNAGCLTFIMWCGFIGAAYFLLFYDPTVVAGGIRVNNIGLLQEKQNGMIFCGAVGFIALLIKLASRPRR